MNMLLSALPEEEYKRLEPHLRKVVLRQGQVLHESDTPPESVYFLDRGVASLSVSTEDGREMELSIVGTEGLVGERAIFKEGIFIIRCEMLTDGFGRKMPPETFRHEFERGGRLHDLVLARLEARITETSQTALCNQMHTLEQRAARWLLTLADRIGGEAVHVTHDHLSHLLGVRRAGVTGALGALRDAGLIETSRGVISILDRGGLEGQVCECYEVIREAIDTFTGPKETT